MSLGVLARRPGPVPWSLSFEDETVPCAPGETVAEALLAHGTLAITRSLKYRRHRGPYCLQGDCGTCLARVDGQPNIRTCLSPVRDGQRVEAQNRLTSFGPDPTALADKVFVNGLDHHHLLVRPRALNEIMKGVARNLAGLGTLPSRPATEVPQHRHESPPVLVIGGGPAGTAVAKAVRGRGHACVLLERAPQTKSTTEHPDDRRGMAVFGIYPGEQRIAAAQVQPRQAACVATFRPQHLVFATGARDSMLPLQNNDLPGVVSARGLLASLRRTEMRTQGPCVVVGMGPAAVAIAKTLNAPCVHPQDIQAFEGHAAVERVRLTDGRSLEARLVALAPTPAPASELARLGGAQVRWNGAGFEVVRDAQGTIASAGPWTAWAVGDVAGGSDDGPDDAERVTKALCAQLEAPA